MADRSRVLSLTLFAACALLVVFAAASLFGDDASDAAGTAAVADEGSDEPAAPKDCYGALRYFSGDRDNARYIVWRESRNDPTAQNPRSSAAGCFQLTARHAWRFVEVGCSWSRRYEPVCNAKAADHLFREAGWDPWKLS